MDLRKQRVLRTIVSLYALQGEPVGSSLLTKYLNNEVSSATLRNDMLALTRLGLLEQPHPSAGRVPSIAGYRYYLENLMSADLELSDKEKSLIDSLFEKMDYDPNHLAQSSAKALSDLLGYTVIATTPKADDMPVAHFELIQTGKFSVAIMAVTTTGGVITRVAKTKDVINTNQLIQLNEFINRELCFVSIADITTQSLFSIRTALGTLAYNVWPIIEAVLVILSEVGEPKTYVEGMKNLTLWQELIVDLPQIIELLSDNEKIGQLIIPNTGHTSIILGEDFPFSNISKLAIMSKRYLAGSGLYGAIAIVGPSRMPYKKMVAMLEYFAYKLGRIMSGDW